MYFVKWDKEYVWARASLLSLAARKRGDFIDRQTNRIDHGALDAHVEAIVRQSNTVRLQPVNSARRRHRHDQKLVRPKSLR